mgnify:CR=1 FL=1
MFIEINASEIDRYIVYRMAKGKVSSKTVEDEIRVLGKMFEYATKYQYYENTNPTENADIPVEIPLHPKLQAMNIVNVYTKKMIGIRLEKGFKKHYENLDIM